MQTVSEVKSAAAQVSEQLHNETTMLCRAMLHATGETDDPGAWDWVNKRAAIGHPSEALREFMEERERERMEAFKHQNHGLDQSREPREVREARYAQMFRGAA